MTFGEHLEALRIHLWKAIIGLAIGIALALCFSDSVIRWIQIPVTRAMEKHFLPKDIQGLGPNATSLWDSAKKWFSKDEPAAEGANGSKVEPVLPPSLDRLTFQIDVRELAQKLKQVDVDSAVAEKPADDKPLTISAAVDKTSIDFLMAELQRSQLNPRTDGADEAFMLYLKVSFVVGLVIASPWVFYQLWLFVAAGLYPHERKYVYVYLPMSIGLFLGGSLFCFFIVIPYVLDFLFGFNTWLNLRPEMKIGTWINFAFMISLMFGISFQLPLVMLFLERISIFSATDYREKRRISILAISIISMILTPSDPVSMMLMMIPLLCLYEIGILLCGKGAPKSPFEMQPV